MSSDDDDSDWTRDFIGDPSESDGIGLDLSDATDVQLRPMIRGIHLTHFSSNHLVIFKYVLLYMSLL